MLTEKYRPTKISEYIGHKDSVEAFLKWIGSWKPGRAALFHGPPGVGKTSLVYAFARQSGMDLVETNASDIRSSSELRDVITGAVSQKSISGRGKIFLFDEVDGISGYEDKGGVGEMLKIIEATEYPVVLIANDPYDKKLIDLRKKAEMIQFKKLTMWDVMSRLQSIAEKERVAVSRDDIRSIAKRCEGDLRAAITDLDTICRSTKVPAELVQQLGLREREVGIFQALSEMFKTQTVMSAKFSIGSVNKDMDEIFWWIENNVTSEYEDPEEVARAFEMLSRADTFRARIRSRQNWKLMSYMIDLMTAGVAVSKKAPYKKFSRYQYPQNIIIMGSSKASRASSKEAFKKMSEKLHCSSRKIKWEFLPYLRQMAPDQERSHQLADYVGAERDTVETILLPRR